MIYPMFAMVILVVIVAVVMFRARVRAVRSREIHPKYFLTFAGGEVPAYAQLPARHFTNLFEVPVLFYAACLSAMILEATGPIMMALAWGFVVARYAQAYIHLTYNKLYHRLAAFGLGLVFVLAMWVLLALRGANFLV